MSSIDRSLANTQLAKAIAYKNVGKDTESQAWAIKLIETLELADILGTPADNNTALTASDWSY